MISTTDLLHLPYTRDLTEGGIAYALRSLPYTYNRMGGSVYERMRRIVAGIAVELAFRRYLSDQKIPFDVKGATPFTEPDRYDVALGGRRCDLKSFLISRRDKITSMKRDPQVVLKAPALVPSDQHAGSEHSPYDLYLFAFLPALITVSQDDLQKAIEARQPHCTVHVMAEAWNRPSTWVPLGKLVLKSDSEQTQIVEIGGQDAGREMRTHVVEVPPRALKNPNADLRPFVPGDADVFHAHFPVARGPGSVPFVQTLHANLKAGTPVLPNTVFLSADHAARHGQSVFVHNGLDPAEFFFRRRKEAWDLFLGKLHSAKGYQWALEAAKRTGRRLIVAGGWRPTFSGSIKYVGEVDGNAKTALLARARCLWNPVLWDEPFGLVSIEALFSGTPVLGTRRGGLPEIVTPHVGALADTLDELIEEASTISRRDPAACREHALRHFTHRGMAERYVELYSRLRNTGSLTG